MNLPFAQGIDPSEGTNALMAGMKLAQEKRQNAATNLLGQQRLQMDQQRMQAENARAEAESRRADAAGRREDRMLSAQERAQKVQGATAILPYLDPNSDKFNPHMAQSLGPAYGVGIAQQQDNAQAPSAPQEPQAPAFVGPIPSEQDARAGAAQGPAANNLSPQDGPVMPRLRQMQDQAAQEAAQQQAERDQYTQQLAESPAKHAKYSDDLQQFQLRKQFPTYQMDLGDGNPMTVDTLAMHKQAESTRQLRTQKWAEALDGDPEAQKVALPMAHLGVPDDKIAAAVGAHREKREAIDAKATEDKTYRMTAAQQFQAAMAKAAADRARASGGGDPGALAEFIARAGALKPGDSIPPELAPIGRKAGLKADQVGTAAEQYAKKGLSGAGVNPEDKKNATEIKGVDGEIFGHAPQIGNRINPEVSHADARVGNARALIDAFKELRDDVATNGNNLIPGTVAARNRQALIANIQAAKRVAESLPASEGGLHLEESQMPGSGLLIGLSTSPELIDNSIARIKQKVNEQNRAMVHDAAQQPASGNARPAAAPKAANPLTAAASHPRNAPAGETKTVGGKTYRKTGPNNWQEVTQ